MNSVKAEEKTREAMAKADQEWAEQCKQEAVASSILEIRQKCRTDLFFLANEILQWPQSSIMTEQCHRAIVDHCQKFKGWDETVDTRTMRVAQQHSIQLCDLWDLEGPRQNLLLYPRGHLKSTIHIMAHIIQWILNYPDIRILMVTATAEQAERMIVEIEGHFRYNEQLRWAFPEFCPPAKKAADWGSKGEFTVVNRKKHSKEPTLMIASVGKTISSTHFDVVKVTDVVDAANVITPSQIEAVKQFIHHVEPLRERGPKGKPGWLDIEGTIYDFSDLHQSIVDAESKRTPEQKQWHITKKGAWIDQSARLSLWAERFPPEELDRIERNIGPEIFSAQYLLEPIPQGQGLASKITTVPRDVIRERLGSYNIYTTVDLAGMDPNSAGDYTAFTVAGFDRDGRIDVLDIYHGRFSQDQVIDLFFLIDRKYPQQRGFKIQKDHFVRVLMPVMRREMAKRHHHLRIMELPINSRVSKMQRIKGLATLFFSKSIRFADDLSCMTSLLLEITRFPKYKHDDILDTLALLLEGTDGRPTMELMPDSEMEQVAAQSRAPWDRTVWSEDVMPGMNPGMSEGNRMNMYYHETGL